MSKDEVTRKDNQTGQALVLIVLLLVGLLAMLALVLDGGNLYWQRRRMQNAADAGAIAGARVLALNGSVDAARTAAQEYAVQRNGASSCDITINASGITVVAHTTAQMTFARVLGLQQAAVGAQAAAKFAPIGAAGGLAPIAIRNFSYTIGSTLYTIWDDEVDYDPLTTFKISGSYRGWLNLPCVYPLDCGDAGASNLKMWMVNGYPGITEVDSWIRGSSGVKASTIAQATVGQILKIPIYNEIQDKYSNKSYYHVIKFAAFQVTRVYASGNPKGIEGKFVYYFTPGSSNGIEDGGWRIITLTQ